MITTDHILIESWRLIGSRLGHQAAERFWDALRGGLASLEIILPGDLAAAWEIGRAYPDQGFSIVDRTSFAVMERLGLERAVTFDRDFSIYRYGRQRERAFVVLR